jgi:hypothetical protein
MFRFRDILQPLETRPLTGFPLGCLILVINVLVVDPFAAAAQNSSQGAIVIEEGGELWIEGTAGPVDYTCRAEQLSGNGMIENASEPQQNIKGHGSVSVLVRIPVYSLECGKKAMNNDMYNALKAEEHPFIGYQLLHARLVDTATPSTDQKRDWMNIETTGVLEIAGVQDTTQVFVKGKLLSGDRFRVKGSNPISMKTYDIQPPTALFGLIRAHSELTIHFKVTVQLKSF